MVGDELHGTEGVGDSKGVIIAGEGQILQIRLIKSIFILIYELVIAVDCACTVDQVDAIVWQIMIVGKFDVVQVEGEL